MDIIETLGLVDWNELAPRSEYAEPDYFVWCMHKLHSLGFTYRISFEREDSHDPYDATEDYIRPIIDMIEAGRTPKPWTIISYLINFRTSVVVILFSDEADYAMYKMYESV